MAVAAALHRPRHIITNISQHVDSERRDRVNILHNNIKVLEQNGRDQIRCPISPRKT